MKKIKILQVGLGPLGIKMANYIAERKNMETIAVVDLNPDLLGKDLSELPACEASGVKINGDLADAVSHEKPDVAVLTTVSDMVRITPQVESIVNLGIPIVSTCEELSFPWKTAPELSKKIDEAAKANGVAVLATGVNPGFMMDTLPVTLTAVCQNVRRITVHRMQNARYRRLPFQKKIGAGLTLEEFEAKKQDGSLRHVGLTESIHLIAHRMGWDLDKTEDIIEPVIAKEQIETPDMTIPAGHATGVRQTGNGYVNGERKVILVFQATVGEPSSYEEVFIAGTPEICSRIPCGVNGDIATCAIALNAIPQILRSSPGLKTMVDIPPVSFFGA